MPRTRTSRLRAGGLALLICFLAFACSAGDQGPAPPASRTPTALPSGSLNTIKNSKVGDRLTITAALKAAISDQAFTVDDVDLPDQGLLVLGTLPDHARPKDLLTVRGTIAAFDFQNFAAIYGLDQEIRYRPFQDRKVVVADDVRSWS